MKSVSVEVVATVNCQICLKFDEFWHLIEKDWPKVTYKKIDALTAEGQELVQKYQIMASPGIIINGELWTLGGFNEKDFIEKLKSLS